MKKVTIEVFKIIPRKKIKFLSFPLGLFGPVFISWCLCVLCGNVIYLRGQMSGGNYMLVNDVVDTGGFAIGSGIYTVNHSVGENNVTVFTAGSYLLVSGYRYNPQPTGTIVVNVGTIAGKVTKSDSVTAISGSVITILRDSVIMSSTTTDTDGTYNFVNVSSGVYTVQCRVTGYELRVTTGVVVNAGQTVPVNFTLTELAGSITGKVTKSDNLTGLTGCVVQVSNVQSPMFVSSTTTGTDGSYTVLVYSGIYDVRVTSTGYQTQVTTGIVVGIAQTVSNVNF